MANTSVFRRNVVTRKFTGLRQNHRMAEVGMDFQRSSGPSLLLKQDYLELFAQDQVLVAFQYLQEQRLHIFPEQPVATLKVKKCFLMFRGNFLCSTLCSYPMVVSVGTTKPGSCKAGSSIPLQIFIYIQKILF